MGLMDSLMKGLKEAAENIDKQAGLSGEGSLGNFAAQAEKAYNQAVGNTVDSTSGTPAAGEKQQPASAAPVAKAEPVALSGNYQTASTAEFSYEIPSEFEEFDSGALEIQLSYLYPEDPKSPAIMIQEAGGGLPSAKKPSSIGITQYSSGDWITWRGSRMKYYGFKDKNGYEKLLVVTASDNDSVNAMMEKVLDHAADTLQIK
ncbi:MAG: hypothetical protein IJ757_07350 [Clostridiales bacterium]|nr:hypothetical protein [Clostridiales bacterium]